MAKRMKKLGNNIVTLQSVGSVQGVLGEVQDIVTDRYPDGLQYFEMADKKSGEVSCFWLDGGLRGAFKLAAVKPGAWLEIVHTGQKPFSTTDASGKLINTEINTYELYSLAE